MSHLSLRRTLRRGDEEAGLGAREGGWALLRHMYAALPPQDIRERVLAGVGGNAVRLHAPIPVAMLCLRADATALPVACRRALWVLLSAVVPSAQEKQQLAACLTVTPIPCDWLCEHARTRMKWSVWWVAPWRQSSRSQPQAHKSIWCQSQAR